MIPVPLSTLAEQWEKDAEINMVDPGGELIRIPMLHSKYIGYLSAHSLSSKKYAADYSRMKKIKWEYYNGRMDADELNKYGWAPFKFLLKADISVYLEADEDLIKINSKKQMHDEAVSFCTAVVKELNNRTFQLRDYISWLKFSSGG